MTEWSIVIDGLNDQHIHPAHIANELRERLRQLGVHGPRTRTIRTAHLELALKPPPPMRTPPPPGRPEHQADTRTAHRRRPSA